MSRLLSLTLAGLLLSATTPAWAHFIWLVPSADGKTVEVYFSESAAENPDGLMSLVEKAQLQQVAGKEKPQPLTSTLKEGRLTAPLAQAGGLVLLQHPYGVMERGDAKFMLQYYAKSGPVATDAAWKTDTAALLPLDLSATVEGDQAHLLVRWRNQPVKAEVVVEGPEQKSQTLSTDESGRLSFSVKESGLYSVRAKYTEEKTGQHDDKEYSSVRHYSTLTLPVGALTKATTTSTPKPASKTAGPAFAPLETPVTSFGGAIAGDYVYIYGGATGTAHSYSDMSQSGDLLRLNLKNPTEWEKVAEGPRLQGLALVAHNGMLYRLGGFIAKNAEGEKHDLHSQNTVARFNPKTKQWEEFAPLPEPRSSFNAAVLGDDLYVIGGWELRGKEESVWHQTAWRANLSAEKPTWEALPTPPFNRRALSVAAFDGKIYAIGGMQEKGGPSTKVDIYDPETKQWSEGPAIQGEGMEGFGNASFANHGHLYVSTIKGHLQQLSDDGKSWTIARKLPTERFFHQMLPLNDHQFLILGGASMATGKFEEVEAVELK